MLNLTQKQIKDLIEQAQHILLLTDERIDGDTIGSTLGMYHILQEMGKQVKVFSPKPIDKTLEFLPGTEVIQRDPAVFDNPNFDLMIIFDCSDGEYIKEFLPAVKYPAPLVVFDHHSSNPSYGNINLIEAESASTADVVWRFIKEAGFPMNKEAAQCILTGICTDTGLFLTSNTTAACLEAAHELSKHGAKLQEIVRETMMNRSVPTLKLWGLAFERLFRHEGLGAVATAITQNDIQSLGVEEADTKALSNFLNSMLEGTDVVLVLKESDDGAVKGSLRSRKRNVQEIAERFGGGGHKKAAGFKIPDARLEEKDGKWFVRKNDGELVTIQA
ncbi:DHH family phosphoesterase [Patescibacteria group bacterium]|nr:DHH family phosphoesterase [Patescibacteria group bacterium]